MPLGSEVAGLADDEYIFLVKGAQIMAGALQDKLQNGRPRMIRIIEILFNPTDYQPEGLTYAMAGWLAQEFNIAEPNPLIEFDKGSNSYKFTLS